MFYKKKGAPELGEIVLCTVAKIQYHCVFVTLDEYEKKEGMIHISEISPGRIRNIRDFVVEGKKIVCKILNIHSDGHIDLSLRRVNVSLRIDKMNRYKQEAKSEKLLEFVGKELGLSLGEMYKRAGYKIIEEYGSLNDFFQEIVANGEKVMNNLDIDSKIAKALYKHIIEKIKLPEFKIERTLNIMSREGDAIDKIKSTLLTVLDKNIKLLYISAPKYKISVIEKDYKKAEDKLRKITEKLISAFKGLNISFEVSKNG